MSKDLQILVNKEVKPKNNAARSDGIRGIPSPDAGRSVLVEPSPILGPTRLTHESLQVMSIIHMMNTYHMELICSAYNCISYINRDNNFLRDVYYKLVYITIYHFSSCAAGVSNPKVWEVSWYCSTWHHSSFSFYCTLYLRLFLIPTNIP